jgi:anti-anti-sigma regulatory factor
MWNRVRIWLDGLSLSDPIERRQGPMLQMILLGLSILSILALALSIISNNATDQAKTLMISGVMIGVILYPFCLALLRRGRFIYAVSLAVIGLLISETILLIPRGLNSSWLVIVVFSYPITLAGLLAGRRTLWVIVGLTIISFCGIGFLGNVAPALVGYDAPGAMFTITTVVSAILIIGFLGLAFDRFGSALRDALHVSIEREQELELVRASQELVITERTAALQHALQDVEQREAHLSHTLAELRASQQVVQELSAPVIPVLAGVLVAPLIGALDADRAATLTNTLLHSVAQQHARYVVFDVTGVPIVDTHVAQVLIQTTNALRLLGAQVLLVGIRPEVAQTMVALNIDLGVAATYADLREAVESLLPQNGWRRASSLGEVVRLN